jgi:dynein light chain roadblock-type
MDDESTTHVAPLVQQFCERSKGAVKEMDPSNDLTFVRLRTKKNEILVAPDKGCVHFFNL